jgi:hypothetical protein
VIVDCLESFVDAPLEDASVVRARQEARAQLGRQAATMAADPLIEAIAKAREAIALAVRIAETRDQHEENYNEALGLADYYSARCAALELQVEELKAQNEELASKIQPSLLN